MDFTVQEDGSSYVQMQDLQLDKNGEIRYIQCDESEMLLAENCQVDLTDVCKGLSMECC